MATVKSFEDLISWQRARQLTRYIYSLTKKPGFRRDLGLKSQIERAAVSTMANQAEGFSRGTKIELINYFYIAKGSAGEVQNHLYVALDAGYIDMSEFQKAYGLADETQRLIQSFVARVKQNAWTGIQHKQAKSRDKREEFQEMLEKEGKIFTIEGVMDKGEAERRGLKPIDE